MADDSLKHLFLAHRRELLTYLTKKLRDREAAADLTQETFLRYAELGSSNTSIVNDRSYLYRTAHNLAVDHARLRSRRKTDLTSGEDLIHIADNQPTPEDSTDARQRMERLYSIVGELPELTRAIFVLNRIDGLGYAQVARQLGVSESTVQKHLSKALAHVTRQLRRAGNE